MTTPLAGLLQQLRLERIEDTIFRGPSQDLGFGAVFGGQVIGQALSAAEQTVVEDRSVHSLHCYFLRPGDVSRDIVYEVERIRDGRSFTTRRVRAIQHGDAIFFMAASFHHLEEGFEHADGMPVVPEPETLESETDIARRNLDLIPEMMRATFTGDKPIEMRPVQHIDPRDPQPMAPQRRVWIRTNGTLPDDPRVHRYLLAYASDFNFLITALQPHGRTFWQRGQKLASLDHGMWFHRSFRFDDWLLYSVDSPSASGGRALVRGQLFSRDGRLVASTIQEGLIRVRRDA